jgi:hypothetical protein
MYIRSYDCWEQERPPCSYANPGFSDESEKETQISPEIVNHLTDLMFFARHPELKGRTIKGKRTFEAEWRKIKKQLRRLSSASNSTGLIIDLTLPEANPQPDYSKTEDELGVWEWAIKGGALKYQVNRRVEQGTLCNRVFASHRFRFSRRR